MRSAPSLLGLSGATFVSSISNSVGSPPGAAALAAAARPKRRVQGRGAALRRGPAGRAASCKHTVLVRAVSGAACDALLWRQWWHFCRAPAHLPRLIVVSSTPERSAPRLAAACCRGAVAPRGCLVLCARDRAALSKMSSEALRRRILFFSLHRSTRGKAALRAHRGCSSIL